MKRFFKDNIVNCIIYIIAILISLICLVLYFVECEKIYELKSFFLSIGTSVFASALLAFTIEYSNYKRFEKTKNTFRQNKLLNLNKYINSFCERFCNLIYRSSILWYNEFQGQTQEKTLQQWITEAKSLFDEFEKQKEHKDKEQYLNQILNLAKNNFISKCEVLKNYVEQLFPFFPFWEQSKYFTNEDINHLMNIANFCDCLIYDNKFFEDASRYNYKEFYNQIETLFSEIFAIKEFTSLQNTSFAEPRK